MSTIYVVVLPLLWARLENYGNTLIQSPHRNSFRHLSSAGLTIATLFFMVFLPKTSVKSRGSKTWPLAWFFLTKKRDHITPILRDQLHWLPVDQRIQFKILLLTYKAFHGVAPSYLKDIIILYVPPRGLRAGKVRPVGNLVSVSSRTKTYGERAFVFAAPTLWNAAPIHIRNSPTVA